MLREASISEMNRRKLPRDRRVLVNRGRGNDELAPADALYRELMERKAALEAELGKGSAEAHNRAYVETRFAERFAAQVAGSPAALERLEELARRARDDDVYLVCYEGPAKACHRRVLMRLAAERFGAPVEVTGVEPV